MLYVSLQATDSYLSPQFPQSPQAPPPPSSPKKENITRIMVTAIKHGHRNKKAFWPIIAAPFFNLAIARRKNHGGNILPPIFLP